MVVPGVLVVAFPVVVGLVLKAEAMASFLMVGTMAGILMATVLNNAGGAWDNAKKFIESGELKDDAGKVLGEGHAGRTRRPSSAIRSAIRSRTRPARRCTC